MGTIFRPRSAVLCLLFAIAILFSENAAAQVDQNLQSRIDTFSQPFTTQPLPPLLKDAPAQAEPCIQKIGEQRCIPKSEAAQEAYELSKKTPRLSGTLSNTKTLEDFINEPHRDIVDQLNFGKKKNLFALKTNFHFDPKNEGPNAEPRQPTTVRFTVPVINPTYETNVLKTPTNPHDDTSIGLGGNVQVAGQGLRNLDVIFASTGAASARYSTFSTKNIDIVNSGVGYQYFLGAYNINGAGLDTRKNVPLAPNLITVDTLTFALQNTAALTPTYRRETTDLFTPSLAFTRQNIPLGKNTCLANSPGNINPKAPRDSESFCYFADVTIIAGQTFSDVISQENANVVAQLTLGRRFEQKDFTAAWVTTGTERAYELVPVKRNDFQLQTGPKFTYSPAPAVTAMLQVSYTQNFSTLTTARWNGFVIQPTIQIAFSPGKP